MATVSVSGQNFVMDNGDTLRWDIPETGWYHIKIGGGTLTLSGQTVTVYQNGNALTDLESLGAHTDKMIHLISGYPLLFTPSGAVGRVEIEISPEYAG